MREAQLTLSNHIQCVHEWKANLIEWEKEILNENIASALTLSKEVTSLVENTLRDEVASVIEKAVVDRLRVS